MAGFFGKLPSKGDFVTRDLPRDFYEPIDDWFRVGMQESKEELGDDWFPHYQVMPIWFFFMGEEVLGNCGWIGVWIPSADRVNRSFPLLMACTMDGSEVKSAGDLLAYQDWFQQASDLLLEGLEQTQEFDALCEAFEELEPYTADAPTFHGLESAPVSASPAAGGGASIDDLLAEVGLSSKLETLVRHFDGRLAKIEAALGVEATAEEAPPEPAAPAVEVEWDPAYVGEDALGKNLYFFERLVSPESVLIRPDQCIWLSEGSDDVDPQIVVSNGLPQTADFVNFLEGFEPFD